MSPRWRYRTRVLLGPWKPTVEQAVDSAIFRGLADRDEAQPQGLRWRVSGCIEGEGDRDVETDPSSGHRLGPIDD